MNSERLYTRKEVLQGMQEFAHLLIEPVDGKVRESKGPLTWTMIYGLLRARAAELVADAASGGHFITLDDDPDDAEPSWRDFPLRPEDA